MASEVGIRELKNHLSAIIRRAEQGEVVQVTVHGRAVARLGPASPKATILPPLEKGSPIAGWKTARLPAGTVQRWMDWDRDDRHQDRNDD